MDQVKQLKGTVTALPQRAQLAIAGVAIVTLIVVYLIIRAATHTDWVQLRTDLDPGKTSDITAALTEGNIENRAVDSAHTVEVPSGDVDTAEAALATAGVSGSGTTGYSEIYDNKSGFKMGTTAEQKINFQRAIEGELEKQIMLNEQVKAAKVGLVLPETVLFSSEQSKAKASISIDTEGTELEASQVKAMQQLVAGRVKDLDKNEVTIVDETGKLLTGGNGEDGSAFTASQAKLEAESRYNTSMEMKLKNELEKVAGAGKVNVMFNAKLDLDKVVAKEHDAGTGEDNKLGPIAEIADQDETLNGEQAIPGGIAGSGTNLGDNRVAGQEDTTTPAEDFAADGKTALANATAIEAADLPDARKEELLRNNAERFGKPGNPSFESTNDTIRYDNDVVDRIVELAPGTEKSKGVSVIIDESVPADTRTALEDAAKAFLAIGPQDTVSFGAAKFASEKEAKPNFLEANGGLLAYGKWALLGLAMIGMAFFVRKSLNERTEELLHPADDLYMLEPGLEPIPLRELEAAVNAASSLESHKRLELQRKVEHIATNKPQDVALMMRGWMNDKAS